MKLVAGSSFGYYSAAGLCWRPPDRVLAEGTWPNGIQGVVNVMVFVQRPGGSWGWCL